MKENIMKKKLLTWILAVTMGLSLLSGCGTPASDSAGSTPASAPADSLSAPVQAAEVKEASAEEASVPEEVAAPTHDLTFPGSENAELDTPTRFLSPSLRMAQS